MLFRRIMLYGFGFNILVLGIAMLITSALGQSAWDGVNVGLRQVFGLSVGQATILVAVGLLTISFALTKNPRVYLCLITSFIQGILVDVDLKLVHWLIPTPNIVGSISLYLLGILCMGLGCALYLQAKFPTNHVDCLMTSIATRFNLNLSHAKWITDGSAIILTLVLCRSLALGTIPILFILGPIIHGFTHLTSVPVKRYIEAK